MPRIGHFEQLYDDPQAAAAFYSDVFGWKFEKWGGDQANYLIATTGPDSQVPGINGGFTAKMADIDQPVVNTIVVDDLDVYMKKAEEAGAKPVRPKANVPSMGSLAYYRDPSGIIFGLFQADMSAN